MEMYYWLNDEETRCILRALVTAAHYENENAIDLIERAKQLSGDGTDEMFKHLMRVADAALERAEDYLLFAKYTFKGDASESE